MRCSFKYCQKSKKNVKNSLSLTQEQVVAKPEPEPAPSPTPETQPPVASPHAPEDTDLTWEDKEDKDKLDAENIEPDTDPNGTDKKYQYKEGGSLNLCASQFLKFSFYFCVTLFS